MSTTLDGITLASTPDETPAGRAASTIATGAVLATIAAVAAAAVAAALAPQWAVLINSAQQGVAVLGATVALLAMRHAAPAGHRWLTGALGLGLGLAGVAMVVWDLALDESASAAGPAGVLILLALLLVGGALFRAFTINLDRSRIAQIVLDGLVVVAATVCLLAPVWFGPVTAAEDDAAVRVAVGFAVVIVAVPMAGFLALVDRRFQPGVWGPYAAIQGLLVGGLSWLAWLVMLARGETAPVTPVDWGFSLAVLLVAWGGITWDRPPHASPLFLRTASFIVDVFPLTAVALCVVLVIVVDGRPEEAAVEVATAAVIGFGLVRQWSLVRRERASRERERGAADRLAREIRQRAMVLGSLTSFEAGPTPEETAARFCARAIGVGDLAQAAILVFEPDGSSVLLAEAGPVRTADSVGRVQPPEVSMPFRERLAGGAWIEPVAGRTDAHGRALGAAGLDWVANAPVMFGDRLLGRLSLASRGDTGGGVDAERLATARELGLLVGAILGASLDERATVRATREVIAQVIDGWAFKSVFQPIVDLATGAVVGHEALTRFEDGTRPDKRFAEAEAVGLGVALEWATLESAVRSSVRLPRDTYLSLNASPALTSDIAAVIALVSRVPCPVVLEITEHAAVESYADLRASLRLLRPHVRIAVDDVGAGYAGLRHILEIEPDLLKLDIALVKGVDADPAKRALIGGIVAFAHDAGCKVVAEGVETQGEARALRRLGVHLAQGYLFGRPARIDQIAVDGWLGEVTAEPVAKHEGPATYEE